jgi:hypothetical protein
MSISNLLVPNNYNLFTNSVFVEDSFSAIPSGAQTLSTSVATKINFPTINVSGINYSVGTSTYTVPSNGVYTFNANVEVQYTISAIADVSITISLLSGSTPLQAVTDTRNQLSSVGSGVTTELGIHWYGFLTAGSLITISANPVTVSTGSFTLLNSLAPGSMFMGKRGS